MNHGQVDAPSQALEAITHRWNDQNHGRPDAHRYFFLHATVETTGHDDPLALVHLTWPPHIGGGEDLIGYYARRDVSALVAVIETHGFTTAVTQRITAPGDTAVIEVRRP